MPTWIECNPHSCLHWGLSGDRGPKRWTLWNQPPIFCDAAQEAHNPLIYCLFWIILVMNRHRRAMRCPIEGMPFPRIILWSVMMRRVHQKPPYS